MVLFFIYKKSAGYILDLKVLLNSAPAKQTWTPQKTNTGQSLLRSSVEGGVSRGLGHTLHGLIRIGLTRAERPEGDEGGVINRALRR